MRRPILLKVLEFTLRADRIIDQLRSEVDIICANGVVCTRAHDVNVAHFVHSAWLQSPAHEAATLRGPRAWYQWLFTALNARLEPFVFARARHLVAVSHRVSEELAGFNLSSAIHTIPNGVDPAEFVPGPAHRAELGLPDGVPLAVFAGDLVSPRKNLSAVLHALVNAPEWHLVVAGSTAQSPFPGLARRLGLDDRVHFVGFCSDMPSLMRTGDLFVFPSQYEPFALVVLEAMASGLPIITAQTVGAASLVSPESGVVLDDPSDAIGIARGLRRFSSLRSRRAAGTAARTIAETCTWTAMADAYVDLFAASASASPVRTTSRQANLEATWFSSC
jgi:glycosyltransferase involved in cell wall biosynthesis